MPNATLTAKLVVENQATPPLESSVAVNTDVSQDVTFEYISAADGGPILRPKTPPKV